MVRIQREDLRNVATGGNWGDGGGEEVRRRRSEGWED
jgi:hypothetical protein